MQLARSLPDGDDEGRCDEDADLTEVDLFSVVVVAGCAEDDELDVVPVLLDLGTQVEALDVLDGQLVQAEAVADAFQLLGPGLEGAQPGESVAAIAVERRRLVESRAASC